jgi:2-polyprenyl-6-methoxyphenol hydroxylase-like FAD-dependent oxidoreductase
MGKASNSYDVAVIGGGPCGLAAALSLIKNGLSVAIIEKGSYSQKRVGEHLPASALGVLQELDVPAALVDDREHLHCTGVVSWWGNDNSPHIVNYFFHPFGHGVNLSRPKFDQAFADYIRHMGAVIFDNTKILRSSQIAGSWHIDITDRKNNNHLQALFVLDASGKSASFSRTQGGRIVTFEAPLAVIRYYTACTLPPSNRENRVVIESCDIGWWYFAPLYGGNCVCMLVTDPDLIDLRKHTIDMSWHYKLQKTRAIAQSIHPFTAMSDISVCSARTQRLDRFHGERWLAIGDAAMAFDPLSSQGITKGLRHGWMAGRAVSKYIAGDTFAIRRFSHDLENIFCEYLSTRAGYYATEQRWADLLFWRRRHHFDQPQH